MSLLPHQSEAEEVTRMQMLGRTQAEEGRSTMSSCGQRGRGQATGGSCICWLALLLLLMLVPALAYCKSSHQLLGRPSS
ncbi:hypothetical protein ACLKA7_003413 [Drosophila subpalustris]